MKGFKPWRSCNSACIAAHQDYDERDDDDNNDDEEEKDDDSMRMRMVRMKSNLFSIVSSLGVLHLNTCESKAAHFFDRLLSDRCWWWRRVGAG